jgi:hypothetical protein
LEDDLQVIDERLRMSAQAVVKSEEKWRRYATFMPTRNGFDGFEGTTRTAMRGVLENHGYPGRRVSERLEVEENEEANGDELLVRNTVAEQVAATRELVRRHMVSRELANRAHEA